VYAVSTVEEVGLQGARMVGFDLAPDASLTQRGGIPSPNDGLPNRHIHTPVEAIDIEDLDALAELLGTFAGRVAVEDSFAVDV